jgi:hypothetical protein
VEKSTGTNSIAGREERSTNLTQPCTAGGPS